jgi:hypothetical protein
MSGVPTLQETQIYSEQLVVSWFEQQIGNIYARTVATAIEYIFLTTNLHS